MVRVQGSGIRVFRNIDLDLGHKFKIWGVGRWQSKWYMMLTDYVLLPVNPLTYPNARLALKQSSHSKS